MDVWVIMVRWLGGWVVRWLGGKKANVQGRKSEVKIGFGHWTLDVDGNRRKLKQYLSMSEAWGKTANSTPPPQYISTFGKHTRMIAYPHSLCQPIHPPFSEGAPLAIVVAERCLTKQCAHSRGKSPTGARGQSLLCLRYLTTMTLPGCTVIVAHGVLPYAPRLTLRPG